MPTEGDSGFEEFVVIELPRLLGLARALTSNPHDAWDLTQDALAKVSLRWHTIDREGNPGAYARTALVRLNIDRMRRRRREWLTSEPPELVHEDESPAAVEPWLAAAMALLTPRQRTAVVLRFTEDMDLAGIARMMTCSVGTAKSHLSRGLAELRRQAPNESIVAEPSEGGEVDGRRP